MKISSAGATLFSLFALLLQPLHAVERIRGQVSKTTFTTQEDTTDHRDLVGLGERLCRAKAKVCQTAVGSVSLPLDQWSSAVGELNDNAPTSAERLTGEQIESIIEQEQDIDFAVMANELVQGSTPQQAAAWLPKLSGLLVNLKAVNKALDKKDMTALDTSVNGLAEQLRTALDASPYRQLCSLLQSMIDCMQSLLASLINIGNGLLSSMWNLINGFCQALQAFLNNMCAALADLINRIFSRTASLNGASTCETGLLSCSYKQFLLDAVPKLIALRALAFGGSP